MKNFGLNYLITALLFLIFALIQAVFLPFFGIMGQIPNLVFILFYLIVFFDEKKEGFFWAIFAGFLLDVFIPSYFGISIASLLIIYLIQKASRYFLKDIKGKYFILNFVALFSVNFIIYNIFIYIASMIFAFEFTIGLSFIISLMYNIVFLLPGFYIYKLLARPDYLENQLKLF